MREREQNHKTNASSSSPTSSLTGFFRKRPFSISSEYEQVSPHKQKVPDLQTQLDRAERFRDKLSLMKVYGNKPLIQPKLAIGTPGDQYEQQADQVAAKVMSMPTPDSPQPMQSDLWSGKVQQVQKLPLTASITPIVQRLDLPEAEEKPEQLQMKPSIQQAVDGSAQASDIESQLSRSKGGGSPLPDEVRSFMEPRFGADFSQVRVHTNSSAVQMNRELNAQAFTHKQDIYFGAGKTPGKDDLTAHELTHVVQQTNQKTLPAKPNNSLVLKQSPSGGQNIQNYASPILQLKHLSISETIANFQNLVTPTNEPSGSSTLVKTGQFYWTQQISFAILEYLKTLAPLQTNEIWKNLIQWIESVVQEWPHNRATYWSEKIREYLALIRKLNSLPENLAVIPLLKHIEPLLKNPPKQGQAIYYELWGQLNQTDKVPNLDQYRSLPALQAIWTWENQACGYTGSQVAARYTRKGGAKKANPDAKRQNSTRVWATFAASGTRDMRKLPDGLRVGDALVQNGIGGVIPKMKKALDDGWILHARVLSGIDYGWGEHAKAFDKQVAKGKTPAQPQPLGKPPEEHSIMLIGYDDTRNEFVFWDPDSTSSSRHGGGFGSVFFADGKLSTSENSSSFPVDDEGNHKNGEHRYQIILIGSQ